MTPQPQMMSSMLRSISGQLASLTTPMLVAVGLLLVVLLVYVAGILTPALRAALRKPDFNIVDAYYWRPPTTTFANLEALGPRGSRGRSIYLRIAAADVFIPASYAMLLGAWMANTWRVSPTPILHGTPFTSPHHRYSAESKRRPLWNSKVMVALQRAWRGCCRWCQLPVQPRTMWRMPARFFTSRGCRTVMWGWHGLVLWPL